MGTHTDTSQQDPQPCSHCGDTKQQHQSSTGDTAVAQLGRVQPRCHPPAPAPGESPPSSLPSEIQNQRHNNSVFTPALCEWKQGMESESERIHQVSLSGPRNGHFVTLVTLRSCSVLLPSPTFLLGILSSPRKALVLCAPRGVDGSHPLFLSLQRGLAAPK